MKSSLNTNCIKSSDVKTNWWIIDAKGAVLGRLASEIAMIIRGKKKACFTPNMNNGDCVVVINAKHIGLTSNKMKTKKHYWHTGFIGGIKSVNIQDRLSGPQSLNVIRDAVKGMLPKGPLGYKVIKNLHLHEEDTHNHEAQNPVVYDFINKNIKNRA